MEVFLEHLPAILMLVVGFGLVVVEMYIPGFGAPGILGSILLILGVYFTAQSIGQALIMVIVIVALLCGWLGDVFLLFTKRNIFMLLGMASFALGHVFYIGAMLSTNPPLHLYVLILLLLAAAWVLFVVKKLLPTAPKSLRIPGLCYAVLLSGTALCALYLLFSTQRLCYLVSFVGGLLFMLSDTILTGQKYRKETRHGNFYVMLTYILAQMLLVGGFALNGGI